MSSVGIFGRVEMYDISRNRFKELKHFCLQYPEWRRRYFELYGHPGMPKGDSTGAEASSRADYIRAMSLIETTAIDTDIDYSWYIFLAVTGMSGKCKDVPEEYYRKFYWLLSLRKGL